MGLIHYSQKLFTSDTSWVLKNSCIKYKEMQINNLYPPKAEKSKFNE